MRPDSTRDRGLQEIGAQARLRLVTHAPSGEAHSYEKRKELLAEYKEELKQLRRKVSLECHPDRTAELPEPERKRREMRLRRVNAAVDFLMSLRAQPPQPRAPQYAGNVIIVGTVPVCDRYTTTTSTSSTWTGGYTVTYTGV